MASKKPVVAAVLNFFTFGGGTLYVGKRMSVGLLLTLGGLTAQGIEIKLSPAFDNTIPSLWPFLLGGLVVAKIGLAIDGYREAQAS